MDISYLVCSCACKASASTDASYPQALFQECLLYCSQALKVSFFYQNPQGTTNMVQSNTKLFLSYRKNSKVL